MRGPLRLLVIMRGGTADALEQILGHATLAKTMRYGYLSPKHLRDEIAKAERVAASSLDGAVETTHNRAQEVVAVP